MAEPQAPRANGRAAALPGLTSGERRGSEEGGGKAAPPQRPGSERASTAWFAGDAERHLLDRPRFCPMCGASLDRGLTSEFWSGDERVFLTWCAACSWTGNVVRFGRATGYEPEH